MTIVMEPVSGDSAFLGSLVGGLNFWGVMGDGQAPPMVNGSYELSGTNGSLSGVTIQGPPGPPGTPADIVKMQYEDNLTSPSGLPENLQNVALDIGKAWWIGNVVYMWTGTNWFQKQMGVPGPVGPTPAITAQAEMVPSGTVGSLDLPIEIHPYGPAQTPTLLFQFDQDSITGPAGPTGPIVDAADYDNRRVPDDGDAIVWNAMEQLWTASAFDLMSLPVYSVPEGSFSSVATSKAGVQQVCVFAIPPQPFNFIPIVFGHLAAVENQSGMDFFSILFGGLFGGGSGGSNQNANIGAVVTLGDSVNGQLVARGFGNVSNYSFIFPHFSTPTTPKTSISPTTSTAVVPAYHTGNQGTLTVSLTNDGANMGYQYQSQNSQLLIICIPVSNLVSPSGPGNVLAGMGVLRALAVKV